MSSTGIPEVNKNLTDLIASLEPKMLKRALRNTLAAETRKATKTAQQELAGASIHNAHQIAKQAVWGALWKNNLDGFAVRAARLRGKSVKGMYRNSKGLLKPLALWFNLGTDERTTRRKGLYRGAIQPPLNFMEEAAQKVIPQAERRIIETFKKKVEQQIQKYGR